MLLQEKMRSRNQGKTSLVTPGGTLREIPAETLGGIRVYHFQKLFRFDVVVMVSKLGTSLSEATSFSVDYS